jgi:hypothetical protein
MQGSSIVRYRQRRFQHMCRLVTVCASPSTEQAIAPSHRLRTVPSMITNTSSTYPTPDLHHCFLKPQEVIARYRWGRTRGYLELKKPTFPRQIGGNYRIDTLLAWEDCCLAGDQPGTNAPVTAASDVDPGPEQAPDPRYFTGQAQPCRYARRSPQAPPISPRQGRLMARPRKDGKPCARPIRIGAERTSVAGKRWRAESYGPTVTAPHGRVVYIKAGTKLWTSKVPEAGRTLDQVFDEVERYLNQGVAMGRPRPGLVRGRTAHLSAIHRPTGRFSALRQPTPWGGSGVTPSASSSAGSYPDDDLGPTPAWSNFGLVSMAPGGDAVPADFPIRSWPRSAVTSVFVEGSACLACRDSVVLSGSLCCSVAVGAQCPIVPSRAPAATGQGRLGSSARRGSGRLGLRSIPTR